MGNSNDDFEELLRESERDSPKWKCCKRSRKDGSCGAVHDDDDDDLLLDDTDCYPWRSLKKIQWFWAEAVIFLYMFCEFPTNLVNQKYILEWITEYNWNYDLLNNKTHDFNISDGDSTSICNMNSSLPVFAFNQRNQMMSSYYGMLRIGVWVLPAMFSTLVLGSVSDKYGIKWAFIPPVIGNFIAIFPLIFLIHFKGSILWLLMLDFVAGMSGSFGCMILACAAHVVVKTTASNRLFRITILHLFLLAGSTVSPFVMGQAYTHLGATMTLIITASVAGLNLLYCLACIPAMKGPNSSGLVVDIDQYSECRSHSVDDLSSEDLGEVGAADNSGEASQREVGSVYRRQTRRGQNPGSEGRDSQGSSRIVTPSTLSSSTNLFRQISIHVRNTCAIYSRNGSSARNNSMVTSSVLSTNSDPAPSQTIQLDPEAVKVTQEAACRLRILLCAFFVIITAYFDIIIMTLFELNTPLCWSPGTIALYTGVNISVAALGSIIIAPLMERFSSHITCAIICCLTSLAYRIYLFFVRDTKTMFYGVVLNLFNMLLVPNIRTMMTLLVEPGRHGAVLGSMAAVEILCCFLGSVIFSIVYSATLFISTALVFLVSASLYAVGAVIFVIYRVKYGTGSIVIAGQIREIIA